MKRKVPLIIISVSLLMLMGVYFNASRFDRKTSVIITGRSVQVCNRNFLSYELASAPPGVTLTNRSISVNGLPLPVMVPQMILKDDANSTIRASINGSFNLPLMPDIPILPEDKQDSVCASIRNYADSFSNAQLKDALKTKFASGAFELKNNGNFLSLAMKPGYETVINQESQQQFMRKENVENMVDAQYTQNRQVAYIDFLVIYQPGYESEINDLISFYSRRNIRTQAVAVNQLPGYNPDAATPPECSGEFAQECYHYWGDPIQGVSQLSVPSLPGFHGSKRFLHLPYTRVSYIPGLIRALIRDMKKTNPLRGVLLVGNPQTIPPFNSTQIRHYYDGVPYNSTEHKSFPSEKLFTDLFYMTPDVPLIVDQTQSNHLIMFPNTWSCRNMQNSKVSLRYWCTDEEWRFWGTPALRDYRNPGHIPQGRIVKPKYALGAQYWQGVGLESIIPVGRLVTQDRILKGKDPLVGIYIDKLERWYSELPSMTNTSIHSTGGSTSDSWIFTKADLDQFQTTFGSSSKIYTSEFFVSNAKCAGRCSYKTGTGIMDELGSKNHAAFFLNGHGGHTAIQAPYANGNISNHYSNEAHSRLNDGLQLEHFSYPAVDTIKAVENSGKLVGVVFANSCSPSDYLLSNQMHYLYKANWPEANERSWAEQWIAMDDAGAMNTFLNGNVGWGGSDNSFNVAFMKKVKQTWESCGTIGDAYRALTLDGLQGKLSGDWQTLNRHFMGSPLNHVGRLPIRCNRFPELSNVLESQKVEK